MSIKVMQWVWDNSPADGNHLLLLLAIADAANDDGVAWPGMTHLANKIRKTRRYVIDLVAEAESKGWLAVRRRKDGAINKTNVYQIVMDVSLVNPSSLPGEPKFTTPSELEDTTLVNPSSPNPLINRKDTNKEKESNDSPKKQAKPKPAPTPKEVIDPVIDALSEVTGMDKILNIGQLGREAKAFIRAGITPEELRRYYGQNGIWYRSDWRGQKGQRPDPAAIRKTIAGYRKSYVAPPVEIDDDYGPDVGDDNDKPPVEHAEPPAPQPKREPDYWQRLVELIFQGKPPRDRIGRAVEGARYAGITPDGTMEVIAACDEDRLLLEGRVLPYARQYTHLLDGGSIARVAFVGESQ